MEVSLCLLGVDTHMEKTKTIFVWILLMGVDLTRPFFTGHNEPETFFSE